MDYDSVSDLTWKLVQVYPSHPEPSKLERDITRTARILETLLKKYLKEKGLKYQDSS